MENTLNDLNNFLEKNNLKKTRAFKVGEEKIPEYAKQQMNMQVAVYQSLVKDQDLMKKLADFSNSYTAKFGLPNNKVMAVCLAILTHLIFIKKINL